MLRHGHAARERRAPSVARAISATATFVSWRECWSRACRGPGSRRSSPGLAGRGHRVVDADDAGWSEELTTPDGLREQVWCVGRMDALLAGGRGGHLFIAGCASNQGSFYDRLEAVVLLSVPVDVLLDGLASRDTNEFGKDPGERARILRDLAEVAPLLRATATAELDTRRRLDETVDAIEALACRRQVAAGDSPVEGPRSDGHGAGGRGVRRGTAKPSG